jgi:hypothetical protein
MEIDQLLGLLRDLAAAALLVAHHVAPHQLERYAARDRLLAVGLGKRPCDVLIAQRQHGSQLRRVADPALRLVIRPVGACIGGNLPATRTMPKQLT